MSTLFIPLCIVIYDLQIFIKMHYKNWNKNLKRPKRGFSKFDSCWSVIDFEENKMDILIILNTTLSSNFLQYCIKTWKERIVCDPFLCAYRWGQTRYWDNKSSCNDVLCRLYLLPWCPREGFSAFLTYFDRLYFFKFPISKSS